MSVGDRLTSFDGVESSLQGIAGLSRTPFTPLCIIRLRPQVTSARTIESVRRRAPVLCGGNVPNALDTSRPITWNHFPSLPWRSNSLKSPSFGVSQWRATLSLPFIETNCPLQSVTHNQNDGRTLMHIPPRRTASRINLCSFSFTYSRQDLLIIFILHTQTGSPKKFSIADMIVGSFTIASAKALLPIWGWSLLCISTSSDSTNAEFFSGIEVDASSSLSLVGSFESM